LDAGVKPSAHGDDVAHLTSADALRNVAFPGGAQGLLWQVQQLLLAFPAFWGQHVFLAVILLWSWLSCRSMVRSGL